jgi:hypothetical protein
MTGNRQEPVPARRLASALEPFAAQVYFAPECHAEYERLGFGPSLGDFAGVAAPDGAAYFCSRGSVMGQVPGTVVAAAFGVFNPAVVVPLVTEGWSKVDAPTICAARDRGSAAQLARVLGEQPTGLDRVNELLARAVSGLAPAGKPLYAGLSRLDLPGTPLADAWRRADMLREYRGDGHTAAWTSAGFDGAEIGLLTELYWGLPMRSYIRSRSWGDDDLDGAEARLAGRGLVADGGLTDAGRVAREGVEEATDRQCLPITAALGDDVEELIGLLVPWGTAIREAKGYPRSGPHDLARRAG